MGNLKKKSTLNNQKDFSCQRLLEHGTLDWISICSKQGSEKEVQTTTSTSSDDDRLSQKFAKDMESEFEMSLLGELSFFLGLQIHQRNQGIFIYQTKYIKEMLKRFGMEDCKPDAS